MHKEGWCKMGLISGTNNRSLTCPTWQFFPCSERNLTENSVQQMVLLQLA